MHAVESQRVARCRSTTSSLHAASYASKWEDPSRNDPQRVIRDVVRAARKERKRKRKKRPEPALQVHLLARKRPVSRGRKISLLLPARGPRPFAVSSVPREHSPRSEKLQRPEETAPPSRTVSRKSSYAEKYWRLIGFIAGNPAKFRVLLPTRGVRGEFRGSFATRSSKIDAPGGGDIAHERMENSESRCVFNSDNLLR